MLEYNFCRIKLISYLPGWLDQQRVILRLNSVQLQLQLTTGTELGNNNDNDKYVELYKHELKDILTNEETAHILCL